jgi:hypothetical protein
MIPAAVPSSLSLNETIPYDAATAVSLEKTVKNSLLKKTFLPAPNTFFLLCFAFFLAWKITWCLFWGVDLSDTGWHLDAYQKIFTNPESVGYTFLYWFTNVVGGTWFTLFPNSGLLGIRIFGLLIESATFLLAYNLLKNVFNPRVVAVGLVLVSFRATFIVAHFFYNPFSVFLTVLAVFFLMRGLLKKSLPALFFAGFILVFNTFARLPNAILFALGSIILLAAFLHRENWRETAKKVCVFGGGATVGILGVLALMTAWGHLDIFANAVATAREVGATIGASHSTRNLLENYWANFFNISLAGVVFLFAWLTLAAFTPKNKLLFIPANIIFFILFFFALNTEYHVIGQHTRSYFECSALYGFYAISIFVCGGYAATILWERKPILDRFCEFSKTQTERTLLTASATIMILLFPVGSDYGILSVSGNFEILAFPSTCALIWDFAKKNQNRTFTFLGENIPRSPKLLTFVLFILAFTIVNTKQRAARFWNDPGSVFTKTSVIDNKHVRHIRTSERKARNINGALVELHRYTRSSSYLMSYRAQPLLSFLTESDSYVKNSWLLFYTPKILERELHSAEAKTKQFPAIIIQKIHLVVFNENSPLDPDSFLPKSYPEDPLAKERYFIFKHFMDKHRYERRWGNEFFDVWLPKKGGHS